MGRHNGNDGSRIAGRKRAKQTASRDAHHSRKRHNAQFGTPGAPPRMGCSGDAMQAAGKPTASRKPAVRTFPSDAIIPETHGTMINAGTAADSARIMVLARRENVLAPAGRSAEPGQQLGRLQGRSLHRTVMPLPTPPSQSADTADTFVHGKPTIAPIALLLHGAAEPLVLDLAPLVEAHTEGEHPVPRERALVAPTTGLVGRIVNWLSGKTRRLKPAKTIAADDNTSPDRPDVALMRAQLRELRAELAIARRVAERREVIAKELARQQAR